VNDNRFLGSCKARLRKPHYGFSPTLFQMIIHAEEGEAVSAGACRATANHEYAL